MSAGVMRASSSARNGRLAGFAAAEVAAATALSALVILLTALFVTADTHSAAESITPVITNFLRSDAWWQTSVEPLRRAAMHVLRDDETDPAAVAVMRCDAEWWGKSLSVDQAERLAENRLTVFIRRARWLAPAPAAALGRSSAMLVFEAVETLSAEAAAGLAGHTGHIRLDALTAVDGDVARSLAACPGWLAINGLRVIDAASARELAAHRGRLCLNGLVAVDEVVAESLALVDGDLCLNGITSLTPPVAAALARHRHGLFLNGVREIDEGTAREFTRFRGVTLGLDGLTSLDALTPETADAFRTTRGVSLVRVHPRRPYPRTPFVAPDQSLPSEDRPCR